MIIAVRCATASASPNPIPLPGCSTLSVDVQCDVVTPIEVRYEIPAGTVTFDNGSTQAGPFQQQCAAGMSRIARRLCFIGGAGVAIFVVLICVKEPGSPAELRCPVNIQVQ